VAAYHRGALVVDLWVGAAAERSLFHTWSVVKPVTAAAGLTLVDAGRIDLDAPLRGVWPEVGAGGKDGLTFAHVLGHRAGLASIPAPGTVASLLDRERTVAGLAAATPDWEPGTAQGEHALTYGHLVDEVVRRADGRSVARLVHDEITGPQGLDLHLGLDPAEHVRVVPTVGITTTWWAARGETPLQRAAFGTGADDDLINSEAWRSAEVPAVNGHATARAMAAFWQMHLDGLLPSAMATPAGPTGPDLVVGEPSQWTLGGARLDGPDVGMGGLGGGWACARPSVDLAWAFLTSAMGDHDRAELVERALVGCLR